MRLILLALLLAVAACATPSKRISSKLIELGVPPREAECVGDRLQRRLSVGQLRRIGELTRGQGETLSVGRIAARLGESGDPELVSEVIGAGVSCALR